MNVETPSIIKLSDYQEPAYFIKQVDLDFTLDPYNTVVKSSIIFTPNTTIGKNDLHLDGENLIFKNARINGHFLQHEKIIFTNKGLTIGKDLLPSGDFLWQAEVEINPSANTALEGLYISNGIYCTQCEAEGFRKITYYLDRPDVMAPFNVKINGSQPVKLSNGNKISNGEWHDPWPKPAYLFALVAGDLAAHHDSFTTCSGRHVDLKIYVKEGDLHKCSYAMDALKRSMKWDEDVYGREYDLDIFMIVAVDDFNMGAMENKGLNIFNSKYILASPQTATDQDYELIESIIAHEYFHNWTGNRITCRDWFQLCLKEGLTVFRDQQFSANERGHAVKRISDVIRLRANQFSEDAGPLAHPCRPEHYIEINNFYTATVYEKGAEVIRMLRHLVGPTAYDNAVKVFFDRHDGQACTIEDWIKVFETTCQINLAQFRLWYSQSGTPTVDVIEKYDGKTFTLTLHQDANPSVNRIGKHPQIIPLCTGFLGEDGSELYPEQLLILDQSKKTWHFDLPQRPIVSLLRGFSAPVILNRSLDLKTHLFLLCHDKDSFNKWESGRNIALDILSQRSLGKNSDSSAYLTTLSHLASDSTLDPAFRALLLSFPNKDEIAQHIAQLGHCPDPSEIERSYQMLTKELADKIDDNLHKIYKELHSSLPYNPSASQSGKRRLRGRIMALEAARGNEKIIASHYYNSDNMTQHLQALSAAVEYQNNDDIINDFYEKWKTDSLVIDKWFAIQAGQTPSVRALDTVKKLAAHHDFNWKNPNRFRSLIGGFATNTAAFHTITGAGYAFVTDWLIKLDSLNPQTTARMCTVFSNWKIYNKSRRTLMKSQLERILKKPDLSKNTSEIVTKILKAS